MGEKKSFISVIVPVYNVEKYLHRCIDSILAQPVTDFELLLIDDGSTDSSGKICDEYAEKDSRVKVFHKKNGGVSSARNFGLDNAKGTWIAFVDSDDFISDKYLYIPSDAESCDVIQKSFNIIYDNGNIKTVYVKTKRIVGRNAIYRFFVNYRTNALWDKLIKREIIGNIRFNENVKVGEDFLFFLKIISKIRSYQLDSSIGYNYILYSGSTMGKIQPKERLQILFQNMELIKSTCKMHSIEKLGNAIICKTYIVHLYGKKKELSQEQYNSLKICINKISLSDLKLLSLKSILKFVFIKVLI